MGVTNSNKLINLDRIDCDGSLRVTLALTAAPDIIANPTDIVLVLDRSGSMTGTPLTNMKIGAKTFIDIIAEATGGTQSGQIGSGSRIGIVSFADTAMDNTKLITSVDTLKNAVDALAAGGNTNHADAFTKAIGLFDPSSANARVIVMFTDGKTTAGGPPAPIAAQARADGIIIYCIGLIGSDGIDVATLEEWASDPSATHVAVTPDAEELEELFKELAENITKTGATNIVIDEKVASDFIITSIETPSKGSASQSDSRTLRWTIPELGMSASESAELVFFVRHTSQNPGSKQVNESITYSDSEGNLVIFPDPTVEVDCGIVVNPEECPVPVEFTVDGCADSVLLDMGEVELESLGRIIQADVTVKNVCPGKRVALAAILTEVDSEGMEYQRGMKAFALPAHDAPGCRDVLVRCIKFVVPESLAENGEPAGSMCGSRRFKIRFIAHNIDTDYRCCEAEVTL